MQTYRVIKMRQPWASLAGIRAKQYVVEDTTTRYRGPIAIYAGESVKGFKQMGCFVPGAGDFWPACVQAFRAADRPIDEHVYRKKDFPLGAMIAVGELVGVYPTHIINAWSQLPDLPFTAFHADRFAWKLKNVRLLPKPVFMPVQHGFWEWEYEYQS